MSDDMSGNAAKEESISMMDSLTRDRNGCSISQPTEEVEEENDDYEYDDDQEDEEDENSYIYVDRSDDDDEGNDDDDDGDCMAVANNPNTVSIHNDEYATKLPSTAAVAAAVVSSAAPTLDVSMHDIPTVSHKDSEDNAQDDNDDEDDDDDDGSYDYEDSDDGHYPTPPIDNNDDGDDDPQNDDTAVEFKMAEKALVDANQLALRIQALHETLQQDTSNVDAGLNIQPLRAIDLIVLAHRMIELRQQFKSDGIDCTLDIGYHYTRPENMGNIQDDGLLTRPDRDNRKRTAHFNGAAYGDGVYTCDNSTGTTNYGAVGLMVARLKGNCGDHRSTTHVRRTQSNIHQRANDDPTVHTIIARSVHYTILKKSAQCCPLVRYNTAAVAASSAIIDNYHWELRVLLTQFCNPGSESVAKLISGAPGFDCPGLPTQFLAVPDRLAYTAPDSIRPYIPSDLFRPAVSDTATNYCCGVCKQGKNGMQFVAIECCDTKFHRPCITNHLANNNSAMCIGCHRNVRLNIGLMPSTQMKVDRIQRQYFSTDSIGASHCLQITYKVQEGVENQYHPWPGRKIWRTTKIGYIPDSTDSGGVNVLLARLKYAFLNGHNLQIQTQPKTMGLIVWGPIPHSASQSQWCDERFLSNMNMALDQLGVPSFFLEE